VVKYGYLEPCGKQLRPKPKVVTKKYPSGKVIPIEYRGDTKGLYEAYRFGPKLRVVQYQETLNPKYVALSLSLDNVKGSIPKKRKNMCGLISVGRGRGQFNEDGLLSPLAVFDNRDDKNNSNNNVSSSHIYLGIEKEKKLAS
jgi:hypothetical protein